MTGGPCWILTGSSGGISRLEKAGMCCNIMEELEHMNLTVANDKAESLWVMIKGQTNNTDGVSLWESNIDCLPSQDSNSKELFLKKLRDTST